MHDPKSSVWSAFQRLANEHPDCNAGKLTLDLQRGFVSIQQQYFLDRVAQVVEAQSEPSFSS